MPSHPSCDHLGQTLFKLSILECTENNCNCSSLKKLKVLTLYVHIVAQVNHRGLVVKVETNCLRDSNPILRYSFLSTTFSIFINAVLKLCVFACSLVLSSELSKCKQSKSILKVIALVMPWLRDIFHLKSQPIAISVLLCKLRSFNSSKNLLF